MEKGDLKEGLALALAFVLVIPYAILCLLRAMFPFPFMDRLGMKMLDVFVRLVPMVGDLARDLNDSENGSKGKDKDKDKGKDKDKDKRG